MKINQAFQKRLNEILIEKDNSIFKMCKSSGIGRSTITIFTAVQQKVTNGDGGNLLF